MDEVVFSGNYKEWSCALRFDLNNAKNEDAAYALAVIHEKIEEKAFEYSGINCKMIEDYIPEGSGINELINFLGSIKPSEWRRNLLNAAPKKELLRACETKFISSAFAKHKIYTKIRPEMLNLQLNFQNENIINNQITFVGKYLDWAAIKKMSIDKNTANYEVAGILANINTSLVRKTFDFTTFEKNEEITTKLTQGKKRSIDNLIQVLKGALQYITQDKIQNAFLIGQVIEKLGFYHYANVEMLIPAYPDLKPPRKSGRNAKKST